MVRRISPLLRLPKEIPLMIVRDVATAAEVITPVISDSGKYVLRFNANTVNEPTALANYNNLKRSCPELYDLLSNDSTFNKVNTFRYDSFARMCHHIFGIRWGNFPQTMQRLRQIQLTLPNLCSSRDQFSGVNGLKDLPNLKTLALHIETMSPVFLTQQANAVRKSPYICSFSSWQDIDERLDGIAKLRELQSLRVSYDESIVTHAVNGVLKRTRWSVAADIMLAFAVLEKSLCDIVGEPRNIVMASSPSQS